MTGRSSVAPVARHCVALRGSSSTFVFEVLPVPFFLAVTHLFTPRET